jgi:hypothetical protein
MPPRAAGVAWWSLQPSQQSSPSTMGTSVAQALWGTGVLDGIDAATLHRLTQAWFAGEPLYSTAHRGANNPPATWIMLWPVFGWSDLGTARQVWALLNLAALITLAILCARRLDLDNPWARACLFLRRSPCQPLRSPFGGQTTIVALSFALGGVAGPRPGRLVASRSRGGRAVRHRAHQADGRTPALGAALRRTAFELRHLSFSAICY